MTNEKKEDERWAKIIDEAFKDDGTTMCPYCLGEGVIVTCMDDLCRNSNHCMHGDGEQTCKTCDGEGRVKG